MNPRTIAKDWRKAYGRRQAREMALTMLDQVKALGESDRVVTAWLKVCDLTGAKP